MFWDDEIVLVAAKGEFVSKNVGGRKSERGSDFAAIIGRSDVGQESCIVVVEWWDPGPGLAPPWCELGTGIVV